MAKKLVKLGPKAEIFYDPYSNFKILKGEVIEMTQKAKESGKVKKALNTGHLLTATEDELKQYLSKVKPAVGKAPISATTSVDDSVKEALAAKDREIEKLRLELAAKEVNTPDDEDFDEGGFEDKSDEELVEYYQENFEVTKKQLKEFTSKSRKEMILELFELESQSED